MPVSVVPEQSPPPALGAVPPPPIAMMASWEPVPRYVAVICPPVGKSCSLWPMYGSAE
ncbi:MAG: hypothetical protein ACLP4R_26595 [Solirubrobacteraceae bacterium]